VTFVVLGLAIASGVSGTISTRASRGFRKWWWGVAGVVSYAIATVLMAWLVQRLPVGVVYAAWTGTAAAVLLLIDRVVFKVKTHPIQLVGMAITLLGVVLLAGAMR
jgi:small multidrug resistance pump